MSRLHLNRWGGRGTSRASILALHGFTGSGFDFECFVKGTCGIFSWNAPDLMGHGKTLISRDPLDYTVSAHIKYLDAVVEEIGAPFVLLGYSMGGRLALRYALERPEFISDLILVGVTPGIIDAKERRLRKEADEVWASKILNKGVDNFLKDWQEQPLIQTQKKIPDSIREPMFERKLQNTALGLANSLKGMSSGIMDPLWERLNEIKFPITVITGGDDKKFTEIARQIRTIIPSAVHAIIPEAGHAAIWEQQECFIELLKNSFI